MMSASRPDFSLGRPPLATVLLRHELANDTSHVDWMIAQDSDRTRALTTFRLDLPLDTLKPGDQAVAEHIGDHRNAYLEYEGPVSRSRGVVKRIGQGVVSGWEFDRSANVLNLEIHWDRGQGNLHQHLRITRQDGGICLIHCTGVHA